MIKVLISCDLLWFASTFVFFFQAEDGIRDSSVTGVQTCALPISGKEKRGIHGEQIPLENCDGAEGGTRTPTGFPTTPSRWRVYQVPPLRHARKNHSIHGEGENQEGKGYQKRRDIRVAIGFRRPPWSV